MVTLEQLRQFVVVVDEGTLTAAADELHLSQPALSRSMQRFERDYPVALFERAPNSLAITEAGRQLAERARDVLARVDAMHAEMVELDRRRRTIDIASCGPAPLWQILPLVERLCPGMTIASRTCSIAEVDTAVTTGQVHVGISTTRDLFGAQAFRCGSEHLRLSVPPAHPAAALPSVALGDLDGETMLLLPNLGFWADLVRDRMPRATFLLQDPEAFQAIASTSSLPVFTTDIAHATRRTSDYGNRVHVPISDPEANPTYMLHLTASADPRLRRLPALIRSSTS